MSVDDHRIKHLLAKALKVRETAYAPYSNFQVGAVLITHDGREFVGSNVENQSYGLTICAESNAITTAVTAGMKKIDIIVVVGDLDVPVSPCGGCRQMIKEFSDANTKVVMANLKNDVLVKTVEEILPGGFEFK